MESESQYELDECSQSSDFNPGSSYHANQARKFSKQLDQKRATRGIYNKLPAEITRGANRRKKEGDSDDQSYSNSKSQPQGQVDNLGSILNPSLELILWRRTRKSVQQYEYLVKLHGKSYLHTEWLTETQMLIRWESSISRRLQRFNSSFAKKQQITAFGDEFDQEAKYFDLSYKEVDRIVGSTDHFAVLHQKKANQIKGKWTQSLMLVISKLINFAKGNAYYGVHLLEVGQSPEFLKEISNPIDLGTILSRVYLDVYKKASDFWKEIGLFCRNSLQLHADQNQEMRTISLTLRECSVFLYNQWHYLSKQRYARLKQEFGYFYSEANFTQRDLYTMDEQPEQNTLIQKFIHENLFLTSNKVQTPTCEEQIQILNPGLLSYSWLTDEADVVQNWVYQHLDIEDLSRLDLNRQVDKLYLVKWRNLSYEEVTWEAQSLIQCPEHIAQFRLFNKGLPKDHRIEATDKLRQHSILVEAIKNHRQKNKDVNLIKKAQVRLFSLDVASKKEIHQYTAANIPVYRNCKMLRSYQLESVNWLIKAWYKNRNVILADEMGLGKTIQSTAFLYHLYSLQNVLGPFLVIAPLSTLEHWKRTIEEWTTLNCVLYYDPNGHSGRNTLIEHEWFYTNITMKGLRQRSQLHRFQVLLTSYQVFIQDFNQVFLQIPFQFIVIDEAHRLKNKNARLLSQLKRMPCRRVLLLTGTPIQNNVNQLWSLLNYIQPQKFPEEQQFNAHFGDLSSKQQVDKLGQMLKPYLLRRMKEDVQQSIPPLSETIIDVEMTNVQKRIYRALFEKNKNMLLVSGHSSTASLNNLQMQLRKCCNHPFLIKEIQADLTEQCFSQNQKNEKLITTSGKMVLLKMLLQKYKTQNKKVLIFSQFTQMLHLIQEFLKFYDYKYQKIDGQVKAKDRQAAIDRYNNPQKKRDVFLLSTKAGGMGINLTSASVVIIYDSDWNPQNDVQATARAHRIGQTNQVKVYRLVTANTYEAQMFQRATKKLGLDKAIFCGGTFKQTNKQSLSQDKLSKEQLETLLKKGMLGFLQNQEKQECFEEDIEKILQKKSRVANYSVISGAVTVQKKKFKTTDSDNNLRLDDPNFWNIVLKNVESSSQKLLKKIANVENAQSIQTQRAIMNEAAQIVNCLIESKISFCGFNADDEVNLQQILNVISSHRSFNREYREMAGVWLEQIIKPSRRFKKVAWEDLALGAVKKSRRATCEDEDEFFGGEEPSPDEFICDNINQNDIALKLCAVCQKPKCSFYCPSFCKRSFHPRCKQKLERLKNSEQKPSKKLAKAKKEQQIEQQEEMVRDVPCQDCSNRLVTCFACKKKETLPQIEMDKQTSNMVEEVAEKGSKKIIKCNSFKCQKFYHTACMRKHKIQNQQVFICPLHSCHVCKEEDTQLIQCFRCPNAFHSQCLEEGCTKTSSREFIICKNHSKKKSVILKTDLKAQKIMKKIQENQQDEEVHSHSYGTRKNKCLNVTNQRPVHLQGKGKKCKVNKKTTKLFTYEELELTPIKQHDYTKEERDWCRYCGSRYSSNFCAGPWGPKTLCIIDHLNWKKGNFLAEYPEKPTTPINLESEQELRFLTNYAIKNKIPKEELMGHLLKDRRRQLQYAFK